MEEPQTASQKQIDKFVAVKSGVKYIRLQFACMGSHILATRVVPLYGVTKKNIDLILKEIQEEGKGLAKFALCIPFGKPDYIENGYELFFII
jgi:hypothetical protein